MANDAIRQIHDTQNGTLTGSLTSNLTTPTSTRNGLVTALASAKDELEQAKAAQTVADANVTTD